MDTTAHSPTFDSVKKTARTLGGEAFRCYVDAASGEQMTKICEQTELGQTELLNKIVRAGLQALYDDGCTITLPLRFAVVHEKRANLA
jgi:hypothetical protein